MRQGFAVFAFEEIDAEISRPPLAAIRALQAVGIVPKGEGWAATPLALRKALAVMGSQHALEPTAIQTVASQIPPRHVSLVGRRPEPSANTVPARVASALAAIYPLTLEQWRALHPFERFVLDGLSPNTRLLWRALDEMSRLTGHLLHGATTGQAWVGSLARCELQASTTAMAALVARKVQGGRAIDLARATGRRTARRASELLDLVADRAIGPVEVEGTIHPQRGCVVWQAHVSAEDGAFLPEASLLACTSAAIALAGMLRELDSTASLGPAAIREEPWQGDPTGDERTEVYAMR